MLFEAVVKEDAFGRNTEEKTKSEKEEGIETFFFCQVVFSTFL